MNRPTIADLARLPASACPPSTAFSEVRARFGPPRSSGFGMQRTRSASMAWASSTRARRNRCRSYRFGFLLQQSSRELYQLFARKIREAAGERRDEEVTPVIEFVDELEPEKIAARLMALGEDCDAVSVIAADHPLIGQAIQALKAEGQARRRLHHRSVGAGPRGLRRHRQLEARADRRLVHRPDHPRARVGSPYSSAITGTNARTYRTQASARTSARMQATSPSRTAARRTRTPTKHTGSSPSCLPKWMTWSASS